jgi:hypothetical protein
MVEESKKTEGDGKLTVPVRRLPQDEFTKLIQFREVARFQETLGILKEKTAAVDRSCATVVQAGERVIGVCHDVKGQPSKEGVEG